ncbi:adenylate/guanylate cyclase domain-containing protein [Ferruginibacter paludis]|uniref:adenylate/guanylate cyclase domain-containing protein n=1 Tax=Ferruginibacter paludis TaxID=1310417 RepID=UPI0025B39F40|nr:adenylate/guanylate cyclase domain-containing protein [Ferruginibacter paludis]MDN3654627.1 adenylate/guanylate cyclase domain-containing protein [Ferruginibacter paludis]
MNCKTLGIILLLCAHALAMHAQSQGGAASDNNKDTAAVNLLLQQSKERFSDDPVKAISLATQAKDLSEKIEFVKGKANALKNIGVGNYFLGKLPEAIVYWNESLQLFESLKEDIGVSNVLNNIAAAYDDLGDNEKALEYSLRSLTIAEKSADNYRILAALNTVASIYYEKKATWDKALNYLLKALPLAEQVGDKDGIGVTSGNIGEIYFYKNDFEKSKTYYENSIKAYGGLSNSSYAYNGIGKIYLVKGDYNKALSYHNKALEIAEKTDSKHHMYLSFQGIANVYIAEKEYAKALLYFNKASGLAEELKAPRDLKDIYQQMAVAYAKNADYKNAYKYNSLYADVKDTLYNIDTDKKLNKLQFEFDLQKKEGQISLLTKDKALQDADLKRQKFARNAFAAGLGLVFLIAILIFRNYREKVKINKILDEQKVQIENLLLNILPSEVAKELQQKGQATPRNFDQVSVMFTDFKSFTIHADKLSPQELVEELNTCFIAFDNIIEKYGLEKIKTIGDSYMCAGGIPTPDKRHVHNMVSASLEIQEYIVLNNKRKIADGQEPWDLRIGVHVGPVVAGVVGKKKYAYDIWGSTVNIASRLESNGEPEQVNISASVYEIVKNDFTCSYRGKIYAKNVGDVDMYFVASSNNKLAGKVSASTFSI